MKLGASALHRLPEDGGYGYLGMGGLEVRREGYSFPIQYGLSFEELIYILHLILGSVIRDLALVESDWSFVG